jgi:hypothetical protein
MPAGWSFITPTVEFCSGHTSQGHSESSYYVMGYTYDIAVLINGNFLITVSDILQMPPRMVQDWWDRMDC